MNNFCFWSELLNINVISNHTRLFRKRCGIFMSDSFLFSVKKHLFFLIQSKYLALFKQIHTSFTWTLFMIKKSKPNYNLSFFEVSFAIQASFKLCYSIQGCLMRDISPQNSNVILLNDKMPSRIFFSSTEPCQRQESLENHKSKMTDSEKS